MKRIFYHPMWCLLLLLESQATFSKPEFGPKGYFRLGTGTSDNGEDICFRAPGAGGKFRLGNECDTWIELGGYYKEELQNGVSVHTQARLSFSGDSSNTIDYNNVAEFFIEFGNLSQTLQKIWVGRRWYDRHDIHINDYFYLQIVGDGGGIELDLGFTKLAYTFLQEEEKPTIASLTLNDKIAHRSHDLRFYDIPTNQDGSLFIFLNYSNIVGREISGNELLADGSLGAAAHVNIANADGWALGLEHKQDKLLGGYNKFSIIYGKGTARSAGAWAFETADAIGLLVDWQKANDLETANTLRLTNQTVIENPNWAMMASLVYEKKDHLEFDGTDQTWFSLGVRPVWFLTENFRVLTELGYDRVEDKTTGIDGSLEKITLAAELARERTFWTRPVLRGYATFAQWSDEFRGQIGGEAYANDTSGWRVGIQIEGWF
jgi:maltoporin